MKTDKACDLFWKFIKNPKLLYIITMGVVVYLVAAPIGMLLLSSIKATKGTLPFESTPFTLSNYRQIYLGSYYYVLFFNSLVFTMGSLLIGIPLAFLIAWLVERTNIPYRNLTYTLMLLPMAIPGMLSAMGWVLLLSPTIGFFNIIIRNMFNLTGEGPLNIYTISGMFFVEGIRIVPTSFLMISGFFRSMDPSLEDASSVSGKGMLFTIRHITLPLLRPGLIATIIFFAILLIEAVEIPLVIGATAGVNVFSTEIYDATHPAAGLPDYGTASTLGMLIVTLAVVLIMLYWRLTKRAEQFVTVTGKGFRPRLINLGRLKYPALALIFIYLAISVVFPFLILLWGSFLPYYTPPSMQLISSLTMKNYRVIWEYPGVQKAFWNTGVLGTVTAAATMILASIISWFTVRSQYKGKQLLDTLSFLPLALPSIVIGLGVMIVYLIVPIPIYGTIWIISIALVTRYIAFGARTMSAAQLQIHEELEEASLVSGVSWIGTFRRIILPLLSPSFVNGCIWVFIHAFRELSIAIMLFSNKSIVLSTLIYFTWDSGRMTDTCALAVILMVILFAVTLSGRIYVLKRIKTY